MGEEIKQWIKSVILFVLFLSLVQQLIAGKKYEKYFRLFAGMVLILIVASPLTKILDGNNFFEYYYMENLFSQAANEAAMEVERLGELQEEQVSQSYQKQIQISLQELVSSCGFTLLAADVELDSEKERYLYPKKINLSVQKSENEQSPSGEIKVEKIALPQYAKAIVSVTEETNKGEIENQEQEVSELRKKIADFFAMGEEAVLIEII